VTSLMSDETPDGAIELVTGGEAILAPQTSGSQA
jgi:hypothetical protein